MFALKMQWPVARPRKAEDDAYPHSTEAIPPPVLDETDGDGMMTGVVLSLDEIPYDRDRKFINVPVAKPTRRINPKKGMVISQINDITGDDIDLEKLDAHYKYSHLLFFPLIWIVIIVFY